MNIVRHEIVELSANERKAFDLVDRVLENVAVNANCPDVQNSAKAALIYLRSFRSCTEEIK